MIKSILGGKSKNLCDVAYLLTLPLDKTLEGYGYLRVLINAEPNTTYTFSRETANQVNIGSTYLLITAYDDHLHNYWLNHDLSLSSCNKSVTLTTNSDGKLWIMFSGDVYSYWQKNLNPFGYIQLELGSTATEYVPHELTSYKSIMKVSDGHFVTSYDERMPCKTKNLFDKSNAQIINGYISGSNVFSQSSLDKTIIIPCLPNTTYTFSKISVSPVACDRLRIGDYTAIPTIGDTINNVVNIGEPPTQNYITITTSDTAKYIVVTIGLFNWRVITTLDYILSTCQLELGTTATDYVPYGYV